MSAVNTRPTLRSVIGRGHMILALVAVSLASVSLTLLGVLALRVYAEHNLHLIARSINYTVEAAVVFNDSAAATEALSLIASTEEVARAEVFDANGKLLAQWVRPDTGMLSRVELELAHTLLEQPISQPILHQGRTVGSIHLTGHGASLLRFLLSGLAGILICTALSAWVALHLAQRLLRGITGPLQSLAAVAHAARSERDFDRRVPPAQIAELDSLGSDFNALLGEMEAWQSHLQSENETLAHQASHDSLTGLPNRAFFEGRLIRALRSAAKLNERVAVLFLDSDRFKDINDNFGHAAGDAVLVAVAERVRAQLREDDLAPCSMPPTPRCTRPSACRWAASKRRSRRAPSSMFNTGVDPLFSTARFMFITLLVALLALGGCQTAPPKGLTPAQVAVLKQQGFELTDEGWAFGLSGKVLFGSDIEALNKPSTDIVERIGKALLGVGIERVRVDGHTDASGKEAYNQQLSLRRAKSVAKVLTGVGMKEENIQLRGLGSSEPVASNTTVAGRTENRRVSIVVIAD